MKYLFGISLIALFSAIQAVAQEYNWVPLVREGVTWVNEKVIINHGDTTRYYYKYEFSGIDSVETNLEGDLNQACYYYTGKHLDVEKDSLIAGLRDGIRVTCYRNNAYKSALSSGRMSFSLDMYTDGGTIVLYDFASDYMGEYYYLRCQNICCEYTDCERVLSEENYMKINPIMIDGTLCNRYAYIDAQGDTAAYVVEGIGFDSRDMGDLLTPFMRKPDPKADYQEYCGLSHVIKDGEIIYKGMRFNPNAVINLPGDVDGDGEITIADANSVIDIVVMGGNAGHTRVPASDRNGDGEVTIADVNAIIDMILKD